MAPPNKWCNPQKQHAQGPNSQPVAAAGFVFYCTTTGKCLFQIEDMKDMKDKRWIPALSLLGGKLNPHESIFEGAVRECGEETGAKFSARILTLLESILPLSEDGLRTVYIPGSKYLVYVVPVADPSALRLLTQLYADAFKGKTSADLVPGDYTRAATGLVLLGLSDVVGSSLPRKVEFQGFFREFRM